MKYPVQINTRLILWLSAISANLILLVLYYAGPGQKMLLGDEQTYFSGAWSLMEDGTFSQNPLWPVGYTYLLAGLGKIANWIHLPVLLFIQFFQVLCWIGGGLIFNQIVNRLLPSEKSRIVALTLYLGYPTLMAFSHYLWPEIVHLTCYLWIGWILIFRAYDWKWSLLLGFLCWIASMLKLVFLPITICLLGAYFIFAYRKKESLLSPACAVGLFLLLMIPISRHNYLQHGIILPADSSTFNLWVGLNDQSKTDQVPNEIVAKEFHKFMDSAPTQAERNRIYRQKITQLINEKGVFQTLSAQVSRQYFRLLDHRTFLIKQLPGGAVPRYQFNQKIWAEIIGFLNVCIWTLILIGFGPGLIFAKMENKTGYKIFVLILLYSAFLFLFFHVKTRFTLSILPILCLFAGIGWEQMKQLFVRGNKAKAVAAFLISISLLIFAFGG